MSYPKFSPVFVSAVFLGFLLLAAIESVGEQDRKTSSPAENRTLASEPPHQSTPTLRRADATDELKEQTEDVVKIDTDLTNVFFTAVDKNKRFITTLREEDIRLFEDGLPQEIFTFQRETDRALSLAILIDVSVSQQLTLPDEKDAARRFVNSVVHHPKDEVAIISFSGEATVEQELTNKVSKVQQALERIEIVLPRGYIGNGMIIQNPTVPDDDSRLGTTAIWDAIWAVSEELFSDVAQDKRRAVILISDGVDTTSRVKGDEAVKRAIAADLAVYAVGIGDDENFEGVKKSALRKIAERTGGRAYFPKNNAELQASLSQIELELRSQYLVAYSPSNKNRDGAYRRIEIELINPELRKQKLLLNYRQGYLARNATAARPRRASQ